MEPLDPVQVRLNRGNPGEALMLEAVKLGDVLERDAGHLGPDQLVQGAPRRRRRAHAEHPQIRIHLGF